MIIETILIKAMEIIIMDGEIFKEIMNQEEEGVKDKVIQIEKITEGIMVISDSYN